MMYLKGPAAPGSRLRPVACVPEDQVGLRTCRSRRGYASCRTRVGETVPFAKASTLLSELAGDKHPGQASRA